LLSSGLSDSGGEPFKRHLAGERWTQISQNEFSHVVDCLHGASLSQKNFGRSRCARHFQLAFRPQPVLAVVAGIATPIQIKFISAMLDLFRIRLGSAVGGLMLRMFVMFHVLLS